MKNLFLFLLFWLTFASPQMEIERISGNEGEYFAIVDATSNAKILYNPSDEDLIRKTVAFHGDEIEKVTSKRSEILSSLLGFPESKFKKTQANFDYKTFVY